MKILQYNDVLYILLGLELAFSITVFLEFLFSLNVYLGLIQECFQNINNYMCILQCVCICFQLQHLLERIAISPWNILQLSVTRKCYKSNNNASRQSRTLLYFSVRRNWRYQRGNQNPEIEEGQITIIISYYNDVRTIRNIPNGH